MLKPLAKFVVALNGNLGRSQIAMGFSWGVLLGLVPAGNVFWIILFVISFFFRHHHASKALVLALLKLFAGIIAPLLDMAGWEFLNLETLQPLFTTLYNMPFVPLTRFNNTLVAGGLVCGLLLWLPVFLLVFSLIPLYRAKVVPGLRDAKLVGAIKKFPLIAPLIDLATKISDLGKGN